MQPGQANGPRKSNAPQDHPPPVPRRAQPRRAAKFLADDSPDAMVVCEPTPPDDQFQDRLVVVIVNGNNTARAHFSVRAFLIELVFQAAGEGQSLPDRGADSGEMAHLAPATGASLAIEMQVYVLSALQD